MNDQAVAFPRKLVSEAIHPAIDHALSSFDAARARAAARATALALAGRLEGGRGAWGGSRLTGDGFPYELAFSTVDDRVRFTVEPGPCTLAPSSRLDVASQALVRLGEPAVPEPVLEDLRAMQACAPLTYGAWLGCRVGAAGAAGKVYVEMPAGAPFRARSLPLGARDLTPRMVAFSPSTGAFEAYFRVGFLAPGELPAVLVPAQGEGRAEWLHALIEDAHGRRIRDRFPGPVGVSYPWPHGDRVTLHFYARAMWGPDAAIRRGFSRVARNLGWDDRVYLRVTKPLADRNDWKTYHGLFGITLDVAGALSVGIGIRPLEPK